MIASETLALEQNGFEVLEDVPTVPPSSSTASSKSTRRIVVQKDPRPCAFELIYFADVESKMMGDKIRSFRWRAGRTLAMYLLEKAPELVAEIDFVVPIPHSPIPGAEAFAQTLEKELEGSALQYATPVSKYRYGGRIFMEETQEARDEAAMLDFRVDAKAVAGRTIFLVDDSIVRGTNANESCAHFALPAPRRSPSAPCGRWSSTRASRASTPQPRRSSSAHASTAISRRSGSSSASTPLLPTRIGVPRAGDQVRSRMHGMHHRQTRGQVREFRLRAAAGRLIELIETGYSSRSPGPNFGIRISNSRDLRPPIPKQRRMGPTNA